MKIVILSNEYADTTYGGAGVYVTEVSKALAKYADVEVLHFGGNEPKSHVFDEAVLNIHDPSLKPIFNAIENDLQFVAKIKQADIVNCHTWYTFLAGMFCKMLYDIPLVLTFHSVESMRPWKRDQLHSGYNYSLWVEKAAAQLSSRQICVSKSVADDIVKAYGVKRATTRVIHCGLNRDIFQPTHDPQLLVSLGVDPKTPYVFFSSRISQQKGIDYFFEVIPHINDNFKIVLCAWSPDTPELARQLEALIRQYPDKIVWIKKSVNQQQLAVLYTHATVFVSSSNYEPFGMVNMEALACGTPVIARKVGGIPEIVKNGYNGYLLAHSASPQKFADKINKILVNDKLCAAFSMNALTTARVKGLSWNDVAERLIDVFNEVVKK